MPEFEYPSPFSIQNNSDLPEIEYPLLIKNTFIATNTFQPSSLDGFLHERKIQSCPASGISPPPGLEAAIEEASPSQEISTPDAESFARAVALAALDAEADGDTAGDCTPSPMDRFEQPLSFGFAMQFPCMPSPPPQDAPVWDCLMLPAQETSMLSPPPQDVPVWDCLMPPPPQEPPAFCLELDAASIPPPPVSSALPPVLRLADALPEPVLGSPELPSIGSAGHRIGTCKPCAFFHSKGCSNGTECIFCHLCSHGEKKRRLKEKRAMQQVAVGA